MKGPNDPVDHVRTTRPHAGESMKDNKIMPALIVIGLALVSFVAMLSAFATSHHDVGVTLGAIAAAGHADDLREGLEAARRALDSGAALERLDSLVRFTRQEVPSHA